VPTYQYACTACGEQLEAVQSFTDPALTQCPACGGALRKVFSAVGVVFKGSGFYKTDSRKASGGADAKTDGSKTDGSKTDGSKTDGSKTDGSKTGSSKTGSSPKSEPAKAGGAASTTSTPAAKSA
jgi:putative FmdB family regulatory protein